MSSTMSVDRRGTKVVVTVREYCAVEGRTTGVDLIEMTADEAKAHASHLTLCAEGAEREVSRLKEEQLEAKRQKLDSLRDEVAALEAEIAGKAA